MATVPRQITSLVIRAASQAPVVLLTGPRQSGKTTLARAAFANKPYVNLEPLDTRDFARQDPRGFLAQYPDGAVLDEIQNTPELTSYLQPLVDDDPRPGRFILTGSENLTLSRQVSQSLAGRTATLHLLPLSYTELQSFPHAPQGLWPTVWAGGYPRIHALGLDASRWLTDYLTDYVERDVRSLAKLGNWSTFRDFLRLAAGRTAQELNLSALGNDSGVSHNTIREWLSLLEASFLIHRLPPWHTNLNLRWVKTPKLHFIDSGIACALLGIRTSQQLETHPQRGAIFETWVVGEILKSRLNRGLPAAGLYHLRQTRGLELDLILDDGGRLTAVEIKSAATLSADQFAGLDRLRQQLNVDPPPDSRLIYGGHELQQRSNAKVIPWSQVDTQVW